MIRAVAKDGCDAVAIVCTNMRGASLVPALEAELGIPIYDSISRDGVEEPAIGRRRSGPGNRLGPDCSAIKRLSSRTWKRT